MKEIVSKEELRQFLINYHNLNDCENFTGKDGVIKYFKRVSSIQYIPECSWPESGSCFAVQGTGI